MLENIFGETNSVEQKKYIYCFKRAKPSIIFLIFLCIFSLLLKYCGDMIINVTYSVIAAIIFYIFTVGFPQYSKEIKYAEIILSTLCKVSSIVETYSEYVANVEDIKCNKKNIIERVNNIKSNVLMDNLFDKNCIHVNQFDSELQLNNIDGFCCMVKSQFMHHFSELTSMFVYIDEEVLSVLLKLKNSIDMLNSICVNVSSDAEKINKKDKLCEVFAQCAQINADMKMLIDKKYSMIAYCLSPSPNSRHA